jgi:asparagine synthase (glutamine-hydrolysing)
MCGIVGVLDRRASRQWGAEEIRSMTDTLVSRGPDHGGIWTDLERGTALGFRRLAIIDLSPAGHQPMVSASGRFVIVFNGEVYNHEALRSELSGRGHVFNGRSDTEVILAAIEAWGLKTAVRRFVGMFALGLWDRERSELSLVRDRLGIKPLYVLERDGIVAFASELKALRIGFGDRLSLDQDAVADYLRYLYVRGGRSIYREVRKVAPGTIFQVGLVGETRQLEYWSLPDVARAGRAKRFDGSLDEAADALEVLLADAVRLRMVADVPIGAWLSGGIDSSVVTALMQESRNEPVRTFAIGFDFAEHDESAHAEAVAAALGTRHETLRVDGAAALEVVPELAGTFDEPYANASAIPTLLLSRLCRAEATVALSGDGGDEVFGGYMRYVHGRRILPRTARVPAPVRRFAATVMRRTIGSSSALSLLRRAGVRRAGDRAAVLAGALAADDEGAAYQALVSVNQSPHRLLLRAAGDGPRLGAPPHWEVLADGTLLDRMMLADQADYLVEDLLAKVDRTSMCASLEVRVPLLDHRVVEWSWTLPDPLRIQDAESKRVLRRVLDRRLPRHLFERPKTGFTVPLGGWLRGPLRDWAEALLEEGRLRHEVIFDPTAVGAEWRRLMRGDDGRANAVWAVLMFQAWLELDQSRESRGSSSDPMAAATTLAP